MPVKKSTTVPRRSYKKSLTFNSLDRLSSFSHTVSNRLRRTRSSYGTTTHVGDDIQESSLHETPAKYSQDAPSEKSTDSSSSNSIDVDAALLSSTLVRVHQNLDGWQTGNWEEERVAIISPERRIKSRFSWMTCCGSAIDDGSVEECKPGYSPYKISRRRGSLRVPNLEIECTLRDEVAKELFVPVEPLIEDTFSDGAEARFPVPLDWSHSPLMLTATPGSGMVIRRVRCVGDEDVDVHKTSDCLGLHAQLPINNGKESQSMVIDFETPSFEGTAMFRIRNSCGTQDSQGEGGPDYFASYNRKFQMVIRGKFRRPVIMADCMSGMMLDHYLRTAGSPITDPLLACAEIDGNSNPNTKKNRRKKKAKDEGLPPRWVLRASVKVAGLFSPRMDADLECSHPRILSPLCSMAQSIHVGRTGECPTLDEPHEEPNHKTAQSLVHDLRDSNHVSSGNSCVQIRKKAFDSIYDQRMSHPQSASPCFDPDTTYTFEFLQHLIDYNDFSLDFGSIMGKMKLGGALKGQPCRFIAGIVPRNGVKNKELTLKDVDCLWSFDLWHESLYVNRDLALSQSA